MVTGGFHITSEACHHDPRHLRADPITHPPCLTKGSAAKPSLHSFSDVSPRRRSSHITSKPVSEEVSANSGRTSVPCVHRCSHLQRPLSFLELWSLRSPAQVSFLPALADTQPVLFPFLFPLTRCNRPGYDCPIVVTNRSSHRS